jgi:hypothetical protein
MFFTALTTHCQSCLAGAIAPISEGAFFFYLLNSAIASYLWWQQQHNIKQHQYLFQQLL